MPDWGEPPPLAVATRGKRWIFNRHAIFFDTEHFKTALDRETCYEYVLIGLGPFARRGEDDSIYESHTQKWVHAV